ncbi:hypothetical protein ACF3N7_05210 [Cruoricaptor ignavus]|uniref:hypothetical protein n=1 Tax=Cruoricaptor ignavus TaxID=1118202 RepID=UPI00370D22A5
MENQKEERLKVLTTKGACNVLGITRHAFEVKHKQKLTKLPKMGHYNVFLYDEVMDLKKKIYKPNYIVVD